MDKEVSWTGGLPRRPRLVHNHRTSMLRGQVISVDTIAAPDQQMLEAAIQRLANLGIDADLPTGLGLIALTATNRLAGAGNAADSDPPLRLRWPASEARYQVETRRGLRPARKPRGPSTVLALRSRSTGVGPPLLIYAALLATVDARCLETARALEREVFDRLIRDKDTPPLRHLASLVEAIRTHAAEAEFMLVGARAVCGEERTAPAALNP